MRCLLIAGSPEADAGYIKTQYVSGDFTVCADFGYETALKAGIKPDLIIGDFDSCKAPLPENCRIIRLNPHKDDTDTLCAVKEAVKAGCSDFVITGASGGRLDHTYANLSLLLYLYENNCTAEMRSEKETLRLICNSSYIAENVKGKTFSVFPFACKSAVVSYEGRVAYPADRLKLTAGFPIGISNIFLDCTCKITVGEGVCLLIINNSA